MASSSIDARATGDGRSGGKILRRRQRRRTTTPYDRPPPPTPPAESPNWFRGIISPAKTVAGKLLSSFWNPETWSSASSSSSSDSDSQPADAEYGVEDSSDDHAIPFVGVETVAPNGKNATSSGIIKDYCTESRLIERKSEIKHLIEQLLMLENFTRDEIDRLIEIMNSRVVDHTRNDGLDERLCVIPYGITSNAYTSTPDVCNQAVMEARKWLKENKAVSSLQSDLDPGSSVLVSAMKEHVNDSEVGSPVEVARSYMRARPPWASPIKYNELRSPSPLATKLFTEATPYLKRDSLSAGSWNIQEEIRKLRSKATEDMLRTRPSLNTSSFAPEHKTSHYSSGPNDSVERTNTYNLSAFGNSQDGAWTEALLSCPPLFVPGQNQDLEPIQKAEGEGDEFQSNHVAHPEIESGQHLATHPLSSNRSGSALADVTELEGAQNVNGSAASQFSLPADFEMEEKHGQTDGVNPSPDKSSFNQLPNPGEGNCELLSEASIEIPTGNEAIVIEFKNSSSSMPLEEPSEPAHLNPTSDFEETVGSIGEKQIGKRPSRYVRKGRGRGK